MVIKRIRNTNCFSCDKVSMAMKVEYRNGETGIIVMSLDCKQMQMSLCTASKK